jgi:hypothetical protein
MTSLNFAPTSRSFSVGAGPFPENDLPDPASPGYVAWLPIGGNLEAPTSTLELCRLARASGVGRRGCDPSAADRAPYHRELAFAAARLEEDAAQTQTQTMSLCWLVVGQAEPAWCDRRIS